MLSKQVPQTIWFRRITLILAIFLIAGALMLAPDLLYNHDTRYRCVLLYASYAGVVCFLMHLFVRDREDD